MAQPILIIGAGIAGLTLAQACRKNSIPIRIFERSATPQHKSDGRSFTLSWSLPALRSLLPDDIFNGLPEAYVNKPAHEAGEAVSFTFYDLRTGEARWKASVSEGIHVSRARLRRLLLTGLDVEFDKCLKGLIKDDKGMNAIFADGTTALGSFVAACDGAHSEVRKMMHPLSYMNYQVPVRSVMARVMCSEDQVQAIRQLEPYFLQGSDPQTDACLCFFFVETPGDPGGPEMAELGERLYHCKIVASWPYRENFFGRADPTDVPNTDVGQQIWMKAISAEWAEPFRSIVQMIPSDAAMEALELSDWVPQRNSDGIFDGRVVLLGGAFHPMAMYREECANHAIVDVSVLLDQLKPLYQSLDLEISKVNKGFRDATDRYEDEALARTAIAVLDSRQACLDAHDSARLDDNSPLFRRRHT